MLPADLDDEQRAHLAHEHPIDLDSGPSSPSSEAPTYYDHRRRPKSASRHHTHTNTGGSSSSHLLARLVSREEEVREINGALVVATERLEAESSRANAAERRALDYFHRLRIATENRERAEQESARLREELKLYKLQLENAQKEIFRAQDIIDQVASQRNEAEAEAARARTKARKLQEEKLVMIAREEGRRMGYREGLSMGRRVGYDEEDDFDENLREHGGAITDEERNDPRSYAQLRSGASMQQPMRPESAPPVRTVETRLRVPPLPVPSRVSPVRIRTPSHEHRTPSPRHESDEPETIRPIPIRPSPTIPPQRISVPPDGWIPSADWNTSYIRVPSPHQLQHPVPPSPASVATEFQDSRPTHQQEPTPVPPPVRARDYAYPPPPVPTPIQFGRTSSLASRSSTHVSQYDLVNKRPGSALRNEIYVGRARSGSQPSRESTSRSEHRDQERRQSVRTEAESIVDQWRADSDVGTPSRIPPRSYTPAPVPHPHRPANFYYRSRTATPLGDVDADPRPRTPVPTESTAAQPDDPGAYFARVRSPLDNFRQRNRERRSSGSTIPNIIVESPSEPETTISPSATIAGQPELLSPEAANRPLPQDDAHQHRPPAPHQQPAHPPPSYAQSQPRSHQYYRPPSVPHDTQQSGTPASPYPAGFVPYRSATSKSGSSSERDYRHTPSPAPRSNPYSNAGRTYPSARPPEGYTRARTRSASSAYEAAPLPPGVTYPGPPTRPQTSHRQYRDRERGGDWDEYRERRRDSGKNYERPRERDRDRVQDRDRDRGRGREQDPEDTGIDEELTRSPAPLQRPISLFDSDEG